MLWDDPVLLKYKCGSCARLHATFVFRFQANAIAKSFDTAEIQELDKALMQEFSTLFEI